MKLSLACIVVVGAGAVIAACAGSEEGPGAPPGDPITSIPVPPGTDGGPTDTAAGKDGGPPGEVASCGDGKVTASVEQCDDANNADGDGCSALCKLESAGPNDICGGVEIALTGTGGETRKGSVTGSTAQTYGHYAGACGGATGKDAVYVVTPNVTGLMTAKITSAFDSVLYARRTCAEAKTEAACNDAPGSAGGEQIKIPVTKDQPVYLFVDGYSGSAGSFTLDVEVATAFCGNGFAEAPESCDDGNTVAGDGCAADCSLEAGGDIKDCPGQPVTLSGTGTAPRKVSFAGSTASYTTSTLGAASCSGSGPNTVYAITSDVDGSMTVRLVAAYDNATLHIRSECDTLTSDTQLDVQLDCRDATEPLEPLEIKVPTRVNETLYVIVDSSSTSAAFKGNYTLDVTVTPGVCGNKILEGSEQCDDGNTIAGDGCAAGCTLEPVPVASDTCPGVALSLTAGSTSGTFVGMVTSSTASLTSDYKPKAVGTGCSTSILAKDAVYAVTSPIDGLITATVSGSFDTSIFARTWCGADTTTGVTDLGCMGDVEGNGPETLKVPITANTPVYLIVDAEVATGDGVFELGVVVTPAVCGNGTLEGGETCDDGNGAGGDGCSATCQIEPVTGHDTCADAETIAFNPGTGGTYGATVVGGTSNLAHDHTFSGCSSSGPDAIYKITAPIDGVLTAEVPVASFNLSLGARSTCIPGTTATAPLVCSNASSDNGLEQITFSVTQGETYYLIVDGISSTQKGTFTMLLNVRPPGCGDTLVSGGAEECDDGNTADGDGCSATCTMQPITGVDTCPGYALPLSGTGTEPRTGVLTLDTTSLASNYAGSCGGNANDGVVVVTPPINGKLTAKLTGINYQAVLFARTSCTDALTQTTCDDDMPGASPLATRDLTITGVKAGTPYYLFIDGYSGSVGKARLNVTVTP